VPSLANTDIPLPFPENAVLLQEYWDPTGRVRRVQRRTMGLFEGWGALVASADGAWALGVSSAGKFGGGRVWS